MIQIFLLTAIVSLLDSIFLFLTQKYLPSLYGSVIPPESMISLVYVFASWFSIGMAIYFLIVSRSDFSLITILKTAPVLGLAIYGIYTLANYSLNPEKWSLKLVGIDIVRGVIILTLSTVIFSFFRKLYK